PAQVATFDAFYGAGDPAGLERPALAAALKALEEQGEQFEGGAYQAYLTTEDPEAVIARAFFRGLAPAADLSRPAAAEFLAARAREGYEFSACESYAAYQAGEREPSVSLVKDGLTVSSFPL